MKSPEFAPRTARRAMAYAAAATLFLAALEAARAAVGDIDKTLLHPSPVGNEAFGTAVAAVDGRLIVGAPGDGTGAAGAGSVYIYGGRTGLLLRTINNPAPGAGDAFGAVVTVSGSNIIIGAPLDDGTEADQGSAYIYDPATGDLLLTINNPAPLQGDHFGAAIGSDGFSALIGAPGRDTSAADVGIVYGFDATATGTTSTPNSTFLNPSGTPGNDEFGFAIAIVGEAAIIGAPGAEAPTIPGGAVHLFDIGGFFNRTIVNPAPSAGARFGHAVAMLDLGRFVVGEPFNDETAVDNGKAHIYQNYNGTKLGDVPNPDDTIVGAEFGSCFGTDDGNMIVGAPGDSVNGARAGAAYLLDGNAGQFLHRLVNPAAVAGDEFGCAAAGAEGQYLIGARLTENGTLTPIINAGKAFLLDGAPRPDPGLAPWINEIHYDNDNADADEGIEIAGPAGTSLASWSLVGYNGSQGGPGTVYSSMPINVGTIPDQQNGFGTLWFPFPALQNGVTDGIALVDGAGTVLQFLSYEGTMIAGDGPAAGFLSTDIGVLQDGGPSSPLGHSLQLAGGCGANYASFYWDGPIAHTRGQINTGQTFCPQPTPTPTMTPTPTITSTGSSTPTASPSPTTPPPTSSPTPSLTPSATASLTVTVTASLTISPSATASPTDSQTPTPTPTASETISPTPTSSPTPTQTPGPPVIARQPRSVFANSGQNLQLMIAATGAEPISYQWFKGIDPVPSATSFALLISSSQAADSGDYRCEATNIGGTTSSDPATVTVFDPPRPNGASFVDDTVPDELPEGSNFFVGITMQDTSDLSWSSWQGYSLGVTDDPSGILTGTLRGKAGATRLPFLDPGDVVPPAVGNYQFVAEIIAPSPPGQYSFKVQMVEEGVEFFGEEKTIILKVVPRPNGAADWAIYE